MNILWLSWKDRKHPLSGGAETVSGEIIDRLIRDGHNVKMITARYPGSKEHEIKNGLETFRVGNRYTIYLKAKKLFKAQLQNWPDLVIDEMNTIPFGSAFYAVGARNILLAYQLAREVWFYQMPFPVSLVGFLGEPLMLRVLARKYPLAITESASTKVDMQKYGFKNVEIFRVGMELEPLASLPKKKDLHTILSLGAWRPMKRTLDAVKAFELARDKDISLRLVMAGDTSGAYAKKVLSYIESSRHKTAIEVKGRVSYNEKLTLTRGASLLLVTSVKEGWGLIVTEANSQGTPAVVYDTDGLRDSVQENTTGLLCKNGSPASMSSAILSLLSDKATYETMRKNAWEMSKQFTFETSYQDFLKIALKKSK